MIIMDLTRSFIIFILAGSVISASLAFYRFYVEKDYIVYANVPCDTALHSCFVGDGENTPDFYYEVNKKAFLIPSCDGWRGECSTLSCQDSEEGCLETFCEAEDPEARCIGKETP